MEIDGVAAIVTGGGSGLGRATAIMLAARGARVTVLDQDLRSAEEVAAEFGGHALAVDVSDEKTVEHAVKDAEARHGVARILVTCAGVSSSRKLVDRNGAVGPLDEFRRTLDINLVGTFSCVAHVASRIVTAALPGEEKGCIVTTASVAAFDGSIGMAGYSASKAGVSGMTLPIARELAPHGIRLVSIAPGLFQTSMMTGLSDKVQVSMRQQCMFPSRLGDASEFAALVEAVIGNAMLNGETIRLDGAVRLAAR